MAELSNPAMHLRMIVKDIGWKYTRLYEVLEIAYFITFLFGRQVFLNPAIWNVVVTCPEIFLPCKILGCVILAQSWLFTYRLMATIQRRVAEIRERQKHGIKLQWTVPLSQNELEKCDFYQATLKHRSKQA